MLEERILGESEIGRMNLERERKDFRERKWVRENKFRIEDFREKILKRKDVREGERGFPRESKSEREKISDNRL